MAGDPRAGAEPRYKRSRQRSMPARRLRVLSYRVTLDVPVQLALQRVMLSPGKIGDVTKAALVLVQFEHKMIS